MKSVEIITKDKATKILVDGKEIDGVLKIEVARDGNSSTEVKIHAVVKEFRAASL